MKFNDKTCKDFDMDCNDVADKLKCQAYDPMQGICPYLNLFVCVEENEEYDMASMMTKNSERKENV